MTPAAVIFDLDGTLLRLEVDIEEVRLRLAAKFAPFGVTAPFRPILGRIRDAAREAAAHGGDPAALEREGLAILDGFEVMAAEAARARPDAAATVAALRAQGVALGLVTDNGRACVEPALRSAGIDPTAFRAMATRDDVPRPKPDPAGVVRVARALAPHGALWYVGDHTKDVEAGRAAAVHVPGLRVAAVLGGRLGAAQLQQAGADTILDGVGGLLSLPGLAPA